MLKTLAPIALYLGWIILGTSFWAPALYYLGNALAEFGGVLAPLGKVPFYRYFNRALLISALLGAIPLLWGLGLRGFKDLGLAPNYHKRRDFLMAFWMGASGMVSASLLLFALGRVELRESIDILNIVGAGATAFAVAFFEEPFFRGAIFGALKKRISLASAFVVQAGIFASVHFLTPGPAAKVGLEVSWKSGFLHWPKMLWAWQEPGQIVGHWGTLFVAALALAWVTHRSRSLWGAIALHAGWVFTLRSFYFLSRRVAAPDIWFGKDLLNGLLPLLVVMVTLALLYIFWPGARMRHDGETENKE